MTEKTPPTFVQDDFCDPRLSNAASEARSKETPSARRYPRRSIWLDSWLFEWVTLAFSVACFITISIVLWIYDGKIRPELAHDISLNTIISLLATGCKSALALVIGEGISQLKWLWFRGPTRTSRQSRLIGIQMFDSASRGPLGSLMVIIHHRARSLASLGAAVIVLLLAFDPFMQQVLSYPVRSSIDVNSMATASAPQVHGYLPGIEGDNDGLDYSFTQGFYSNQGFSVPPQCSSGNCTWDKFPSVGICSQCSNMTTTAVLDCHLPSMAKTFNKSCKVSLPGGFDYTFNATRNQQPPGSTPLLLLPSEIIWQPLDLNNKLMSLYPTNERVVFNLPNVTIAGIKNPLTTIAYLQIELGGQTSPNASASESMYIKNATVCGLSTCLRDYTVSVKNGASSIHAQNVDFGTVYLKNPGESFPGNNISIETNPLCWMPGPTNTTGYRAARDFTFCDPQMSILGEIREYFPATETATWAANGHAFHKSLDGFLNDESRARQLNRVGFERIVSNIADSLTKYGLEKTNSTVSGKVHVTQVFVGVKWLWMIFPGLVVVFGTNFLVITIVVSNTSEIPLRKSSALASYYHGIERPEENDDDGEDHEYLHSSIMEKKAMELNVQLERSRKNGRLVLQLQETSNAAEQFIHPN